MVVAGGDPNRPQVRQCFGGGIEVAIAPRFADISDFRPVPDHQEVFADGERDQSIIVEILERADVPDEECAAYFWNDLAGANDAQVASVQATRAVGAEEAPGLAPGCSCWAAVGTLRAAKHREATTRGADAENEVLIAPCHRALSWALNPGARAPRLPRAETDILVSLNTPLVIGAGSSSAEAVGGAGPTLESWMQAQGVPGGAEEVFREAVRSFVVKDWGLFGGGEGGGGMDPMGIPP